MRRLCFTVIILAVAVSSALAQEWVDDADRDMEYNCTVVEQLLADYGHQNLVRDDAELSTVGDYFAALVPACFSEEAAPAVRSVIVKGGAYLRDCAAMTCDVIGRAGAGAILKVADADGGWYAVDGEAGRAFIPAWLTRRGPDAVIETDEIHQIEANGCIVAPDANRGPMTFNVIITGLRMDDVLVDVHRPGERAALPVWGQEVEKFIDAEDYYIHQFYSADAALPTGGYLVEIALDGVVRLVGWNVRAAADYDLFVICD